VLPPRQQVTLARGTKDKEHAMSEKLNTAITVIGIDIGKNSFHVVGLDKRGAIALRQKWSRGHPAHVESDGRKLYIEGLFLSNKPNKNNRLYEQKTLDSVVGKIKSKIANGNMFGELGHGNTFSARYCALFAKTLGTELTGMCCGVPLAWRLGEWSSHASRSHLV
jgi:hypothetical protein